MNKNGQKHLCARIISRKQEAREPQQLASIAPGGRRGARVLKTREGMPLLRILTAAAATPPSRSGWRNFLQEPRESKLGDFSLLLYCVLDLLQNTHRPQAQNQAT